MGLLKKRTEGISSWSLLSGSASGIGELTALTEFIRKNGQALSRNHEAPVRLVMSGWYRCTSIKRVNAVTFTDEKAPATSQMQEFATRTYQQAVPKLARDHRPAIIDQASTAIRAWSRPWKYASTRKWTTCRSVIFRRPRTIRGAYGYMRGDAKLWEST